MDRASRWTILDLLKWTTAYFKKHAIEAPRPAAEILLAHALKLRRIDLYLQYDRPLEPSELSVFKTFVKRRAAREPVAYIVESKAFWTMELAVTPDVLIPRPETECLVETVLTTVNRTAGARSNRILELGTGSGAIAIALAGERPADQVFAGDISIAAVCQARANARRNGLAGRIHFFVSDWFGGLNVDGALFDVVVSNPPYIPSAQIAQLAPEICRYEPALALDGDTDGLKAYRRIVGAAHRYLRPGGCLFCEIGADQGAALRGIVEKSGPYVDLAIYPDYSGHDRVLRVFKRR